MTPTQIAVTIAVGVGPTALLLALFGWLVWLDRPARVTQQQPPAVVVVPDDLTALADVLVVDPPTTYGQQVTYRVLPCGDAYPLQEFGDGYTCDRPKGHPGLHGEGALAWEPTGDLFLDHGYRDPDLLPSEVIVGTAKVHRGCRDLRRDGRPDEMCNHCAPLLARSATEVQW